jgi:hypothetical protein
MPSACLMNRPWPSLNTTTRLVVRDNLPPRFGLGFSWARMVPQAIVKVATSNTRLARMILTPLAGFESPVRLTSIEHPSGRPVG